MGNTQRSKVLANCMFSSSTNGIFTVAKINKRERSIIGKLGFP